MQLQTRFYKDFRNEFYDTIMVLVSVLELRYYAHRLREGVYGDNPCKNHIYIKYSQEQATLIVVIQLPASCSFVLSNEGRSTRRLNRSIFLLMV